MRYFLVFSVSLLVAISLAKNGKSKTPNYDLGIVKPVNSKRLLNYIGEIQSVSNYDLVDTLKEICDNGTLALKNNIPDEDVYDLVKHFEDAFKKFGYSIGKVFFTGRLLLTRSHLAGMFYNKKNKKVYEKVCDDISYDMLDMSSEEGVDGSSAVSSDVSKGKSSAVLPVASADRAILCLLANTGRYAEEAGEAMKQLENEIKNSPPPPTCTTLDPTKTYTPKEILAIFLVDLKCFNNHIIHLSDMIDSTKSQAKERDFEAVRHAVVKSMILFIMMISEATQTLQPFFTMVYENVPGPTTTSNATALFEEITSQNMMNIVPALY